MKQDTTDDYIKRNKIKNLRRVLYATWDSCVVISKGPNQEKIDRIISTALRQLKQDGRLTEIISNIHQPYNDWQPFKMNW